MKSLTKILVCAIAGTALGWSAAGVSLSPGKPAAAEESATTAARSRARRSSRPVSTPSLADAAACRELWEISSRDDGRHPLLRRLDRERALRRWLEIDPEGALAEAEKGLEDGFASGLFQQWIELDPAAALDALNRSGGKIVQEAARDFFLNLLAKDSAMAAAELAKPRWRDANPDAVGWDFQRTLGEAWLRADPAAAIASLGAAGIEPKNTEYAFGIADAWAATDFNSAWEHFFPNADFDKFSMTELGPRMLGRGILAGSAEALKLAVSAPAKDDLPDPFSRDPFHDIADVMTREDPRAALEWAAKRPEDDPLRLKILAGVADSLASSDPERALALLRESSPTAGGDADPFSDFRTDSLLRQIFAALAADDPAATAGRVAGLPENQRTGAMTGYLTHVFLSDPAAATAQCQAWLADPALKADVPAAWAQSFSWGHGAGIRDPAGMLEAIPELNDAVDPYVLSTWAKGDPEAAAGWIGRRLEAGEKVPLGDKGTLAELAISKPEFTAVWLAGLPESALRKSGAETLTANWGAFDPAAARAWTESLPVGELRSAAEAGLKRTGQPNRKPW